MTDRLRRVELTVHLLTVAIDNNKSISKASSPVLQDEGLRCYTQARRKGRTLLLELVERQAFLCQKGPANNKHH